jgi:transcriptional regulator with XRE-family HTH domain
MADETGESDKTLYQTRHRIFGELLRDLRLRAGLTQLELVGLLRKTQTYASEAERALRRLDIAQMQDWATVCGTTLDALVAEFLARQLDDKFAEPTEPDGRKREARRL